MAKKRKAPKKRNWIAVAAITRSGAGRHVRVLLVLDGALDPSLREAKEGDDRQGYTGENRREPPR